MNSISLRAAGGALWLASCGCAFAQAGGTLPPVVITGNPLGASDLVAPAESLSGTGLVLRSQGSLGETLSGIPGVSSTYFGPAASRPVVRGLDGDRVRILNNSGALSDVSSLSYDHAVAADPITVERIEVLRGPAALLYGGNAIGGAVNIIDNRIPREAPTGPTGKADLGMATGNSERSGAVLVEGGTARIGLHADLFRRSGGEVRVPIDLPCAQGGAPRVAPRLCNSQAASRGGALGGSVFFDDGYLGASASSYGADYGAVSEDEVTVGMFTRRRAIEGEWRKLPGLVSSVKVQASHSDYAHTEYDAGAPGTLFAQRGSDLRVEARHRAFGALEGVWGLQADRSRFSALGSEAFAPNSRTRQQALFAYEELGASWGKLTFGLRAESVDVDSLGNPGVPRFATGGRSFHPRSAALGALWRVAPGWQLTGNLSHSERAPKDYELFANGPHVATGAYEVGDPALGVEKSANVEAGAQWKSGPNRFTLTVFQSRFSRHIALAPTGRLRDEEGNGADFGVTDCGDGTSVESGCTAGVVPEFAYRSGRAVFRGLEAGGSVRLLEGGDVVDLELRADAVRARNAETGEPLARIPPVRLGATLEWSRGGWGARLGADHHAQQRRVPAGALPVGGYTLVHAALTYRQQSPHANLLWFLRADNATDRLAYPATSMLTQTAPGRVPLPGRSLKLGVHASFF